MKVLWAPPICVALNSVQVIVKSMSTTNQTMTFAYHKVAEILTKENSSKRSTASVSILKVLTGSQPNNPKS